MNLLSEEEIEACAADDAYDLAFARAIESALLAKLASAELPESAERFVFSGSDWHKAMRLAHAQGFAAGAAAQLAEKPSAWKWKVNRFHQHLEDYCPPDDAYDEGTLIELYTRREA